MRKPDFDPLSYIPSPEAIQSHLDQAERLARRLRALLRVSVEVRNADRSEDEAPSMKGGEACKR